EKCKPYDFYQYWVNVQDADVIKCLKLVTFVPMDEIREMEKWEGAELNKAKKRLAYEVTKMVHGEEIANQVQAAAEAVFAGGGVSADMPTTELETIDGMGVLDLLAEIKIVASKAEGRRLIQQNGLSINDEKVRDVNMTLDNGFIGEDGMIVKKGKKVFHRVILKK
ncbi:MAG: tyrosine--tRNA ligase, partial [Clostridiales bacterium]|nr:tyrosine--tRNA ligase [Clostridiales bacterium]